MEKQFVLKAKTAVKRVAAISAGATMMGATMMGAVAADLGDYPSPFVNNGELNGLVVVGSASSAGDIVGAGDLISTLTQATVSASSATTVTEGGEDAEVSLDNALPGSLATLDDEKIAGLIDTEIEWNDTDYDVSELITAGTGLKILVSSTENEEEMGSTPYLGTGDASNTQLMYNYSFEDDISAMVSGVSTDDPITLDILGKSFEITNMAEKTFTYKLADEYSLFVGESVTVNGKSVELVNVASGADTVVVKVDGEQETVGTSSETVNGLKVEVSETFYSDNLEDRFAVIRAGEDISKTATDSTPVELFGLDEDDTDNPWDWDINLTHATTNTGHIAITWDETSDETADDYPPVALGGSFDFPNNFASVKFDSLTVDDYETLTVNFGATENIDGTTYGVVEFVTSHDDGLYMNEADEVDVAYIFTVADTNVSSWAWQDDDGDWNTQAVTDASSGTEAQYQYDTNQYANFSVDTVALLASPDYNVTLELSTIAGSDNLVFEANKEDATDSGSDVILGDAQDEEAAEVKVGSSNYGTKDFDLLFAGGFILENPESNGNGDGKIVMEIPSEEVKANVIVTGPGTSTTTAEYSSVTVNSVAGQSVIKLDTEVTDPASRNLILVGGPAVNRLTAQAMGLNYPTTGADSGIPEGAALIRMIDNAFGGSNTAVVVAGWDAEDTRAAASVLQNYRSYANQLDGKMEVKVSGTSVSAVGGDVATE